MTYKVTPEFISVFKEYYSRYGCRPIDFSNCTGSLGFSILLEDGSITRISGICLKRIVEAIIGEGKDVESTEEYRELEKLLEKDTDAVSPNISEVQKINMTYALYPEFSDKLRKLRMSANFTSRELSKYMLRSTSYISHLEKGVIQAINKSDLAYLTLVLTGNLLGEELKDKEETIKVENQEDVIKYLMSSTEENPNKLRNFFKDREMENGIEIETSDVLLKEEGQNIDILYAQAFLNLKKLERSKKTENEKIVFMQKVNDFLTCRDRNLIEDIIKIDYSAMEADTLEKIALEWKQLCKKFNI